VCSLILSVHIIQYLFVRCSKLHSS